MLMEQRDRPQQEVDQLMAENLVQNDNYLLPSQYNTSVNAVLIKVNDLEEVPSVVDNVTDISPKFLENKMTGGVSQNAKQATKRYNASASNSKSQTSARDKSQYSNQKSGRSNIMLKKGTSFSGINSGLKSPSKKDVGK